MVDVLLVVETRCVALIAVDYHLLGLSSCIWVVAVLRSSSLLHLIVLR